MFGLESRPRRTQRVLSQQASDTLVLFNLDDGQYCALNEVGGKVWELCDGTRSVSEMVSVIREEYDVSEETVAADVLEVLADLANEKLLVHD